MDTQWPPLLNLPAKNLDKINSKQAKNKSLAAAYKLERQSSARGVASAVSEGSEYRLGLPDRLVSGAPRRGSAGSIWLGRRLSNATHLDRALVAPSSNRTSSAIEKRSLGAFVPREAMWERFGWWIEAPAKAPCLCAPYRSTGGW